MLSLYAFTFNTVSSGKQLEYKMVDASV